MSDQTIHSPAEANGKPILVGDRGGLKTKDEFKSRDEQNQAQQKVEKPVATCQGPGYDMGFFKRKDGYEVRYKGPNCQDVLKRIKKYIDSGVPITEAVNRIHMED